MDALQFVRFCEDVLEHPAGEDMGRPFRLEDWQVDIFTAALELDEQHRPVWQTVATCIPTANGKTTMLAAYALYRLLADTDNAKVLMCAASDKQANRLFEAARGMVERSPFLLERIAIQDYRGRLYRLDDEHRRLDEPAVQLSRPRVACEAASQRPPVRAEGAPDVCRAVISGESP